MPCVLFGGWRRERLDSPPTSVHKVIIRVIWRCVSSQLKVYTGSLGRLPGNTRMCCNSRWSSRLLLLHRPPLTCAHNTYCNMHLLLPLRHSIILQETAPRWNSVLACLIFDHFNFKMHARHTATTSTTTRLSRLATISCLCNVPTGH